MRIAIRENDIFPEEQWADWIRENPSAITEEPFNYQIIEIPDDIELKKLAFKHFDCVNGQYQFNAEKYNEIFIEELRARRSLECFSVIDRSVLWHNRLTEEQKTELNVWYQAWLNVTETKVIPEKPAWLEEK